MKPAKSAAAPAAPGDRQQKLRERILGAAFAAFMERGYAGASTLAIATRAKVSKRELYALFEDKRAILAACIDARARRMRQPLELPTPDDRAGLSATLARFGAVLMREVCQPGVLAVYRLALMETEASPEVAQVLDAGGRSANLRALADLLRGSQARGLLGEGDPTMIAAQFLGLLWGDVLMRLLLRVRKVPTAREIERRSQAATRAILTLYPGPAPSRP